MFPVWPVTDKQPLELHGQAVLVVGCGAVGRAFGQAFGSLGAELLLWSRAKKSASALAETCGAEVCTELGPAMERARLVCLAVADDALEGLVRELGCGSRSRGFVFHTNGTAGHDLLAPLARLGWQTAKLHPLRAFPQGAEPQTTNFRETWFASACEAAERPLCSALVRSLGGHELPLTAAGSLAMHSAACLLSGGLVALFDQALEVAAGASRDPLRARDALAALLSSTTLNLMDAPPAEALSGPIARGADGLVARQLEALSPEARELYRLLGKRMLELSHGREAMDPEALARLRKLLS